MPDVTKHRLDNGLVVWLLPDASAPIFTLEIWYRVGSADEHEATPGEDHGTTGLSHFFEHLMFRGTERYPRFFDHVYERGGQLNAWTWLDATCYWDKLPREHLRFALVAEADRLANMKLDFLNLEPEREVVKSERLLRTDNDPSGAISEVLHRRAYLEHPYGWPTVGWMHDLNCITLEEATAYYRPRYAPSNAFMVLVGDFEPDEALAAVDETFGAIPAGPPLPPRGDAEEPRQEGTRRDRTEKPVTSPLFQMAWHAPAGDDERFVAVEVLHYLLVRGKSSRIQRELVYGDDPIATSISASLFPLRQPYLSTWEVSVRPGHSPREAEARVLAELQRLQDDPPDSRELQRAINGLSADLVRATLTSQGKADNVGFAYLATGDPLTFLARLELYPQVTPRDVQAAASEWFELDRRTVVTATDPGAPVALVKRFAGEEPTPAAALLIEAMVYARTRSEVADRENELDGEALAIERLDARYVHARGLTDDAELQADLDRFASEDEKGPTRRRALLESARADNAASRLAVERTGEDLRARLDALDVASSPLGTALRAAAAAYLGQATPDALGEALAALDEQAAPVLGLALGHVRDLAGDDVGAQQAYAAVLEAAPIGVDPRGVAGDIAWERQRIFDAAEEGDDA